MFKYGKHLSQTKSDQGVANLLCYPGTVNTEC
jgi:hypothetical protein